MMDTETIFDYYTETFQLPDGSYVCCEIIDTGGQEKYDSQNRTYYKRADCCLLVYDITNVDSFKAIENFYINEINNNCKKGVKVILVGNKTDLKDKRKISEIKGANLATKYKFYFKETSCEYNSNVADAFETIIIMTHNDMIKNNKYKDRDSIMLNNEGDNESLKINDNISKKKIKKKEKCC